MSRVLLAALLALAPMVSDASAQDNRTSSGTRDTASVTQLDRPFGRPEPSGITRAEKCAVFPCTLAALPQDSARPSRRGRYALWGFVIGAGTGWFISHQSCQKTDCYISGAGLLMVTGGLLGMLVGVIIS